MKPIAKKRSGIAVRSKTAKSHQIILQVADEEEIEAEAIGIEKTVEGEQAAIQARTSLEQQAGLEVETTTTTKKTTQAELEVEQATVRAVPDIILIVDMTIRVEATARHLIEDRDRPITIDTTVATIKTRSRSTVDVTTTTIRVKRPILQNTIRLLIILIAMDTIIMTCQLKTTTTATMSEVTMNAKRIRALIVRLERLHCLPTSRYQSLTRANQSTRQNSLLRSRHRLRRHRLPSHTIHMRIIITAIIIMRIHR